MHNKKQKTYSLSHDLNAYVVRITENTATLESVSKTWKTVFAVDTKMYYHISGHFKNEAWKELELLASALYTGSILTVIDAEFIKGLGQLFEEYQKRCLNAAPEDSDDTEEEILQQEKNKQEHKEALMKKNEDSKN